jgi:hypothetical protein
MSNGPSRTHIHITIGSLLVASGFGFAYCRCVNSNRTLLAELTELQSAIRRLQAENLELRRSEEASRDSAAAAASAKVAVLPPGSEIDAGGVIEGVFRIKEFLAAHPEKGIPEMRLLKDEDWLARIEGMPLNTFAAECKALASVRELAQMRLGEMVGLAMKDFMTANGGQMPASPGQLALYLPPNDADLLQGVDAADMNRPHPWILTHWVFQKDPMVDPWYDSTLFVATNEWGTRMTGPGFALEDAFVAFQKAMGSAPASSSDLLPYLKTPIDPSTMSALFEAMRPAPNAPPTVGSLRNPPGGETVRGPQH